MNATLLFVDDDSMVLNALERTFFEAEFTTFFTQSAIDAYDILEKNTVDLVVSDIRMLPVSGADFLREVKKRYPNTIRIVLSAYGDRNMMVKVICEGLAQVYILKPWDNQKLISQISHLISMHRNLMEIQKTIGTGIAYHLPVLPSLYTKMLVMIEEGKSLKEIAAIIETDPATTANILKLANSSFFGLTISTVHQALVYLGVTSVKDIVLVSELFAETADTENHDLRHQINNHMVYTSKLLHGLHQHLLASRIPEEFSVAGLLADIGRLFLLEYNPDKYRSALTRYIDGQEIPLAELERMQLGFSHTQLGALILDWWNLPVSLVEASLYHHDHPFKTEILTEQLIKLIYIADRYAWSSIEAIGPVTIEEDILSGFSITRDQLDEIVHSITSRSDFVLNQLNS